MKVQQFLAHHGVAENPFGQEDATSDHVFREHLLTGTRHPAWDKIYGSPSSPSTAVVFGEKGSGKTAMRLQIASELERHNRQHPGERAFVIEYDDFNPLLDSFRDRLHGRNKRPDRALARWRLWDHMDALLMLGTTRLVDYILDAPPVHRDEHAPLTREKLRELNPQQKRDILLLAAVYDHSYNQSPWQRWRSLNKRLKRPFWKSLWGAWWDVMLGGFVTILTVVLVWATQGFSFLFQWWVALVILAGWAPWLWRQGRLTWKAWHVHRQIRVFDRLVNQLRRILSRFERNELAGQPLPDKDRSDDRYELFMKLQSVLSTLGYTSIVVLIDRVDEPHLVNGSPERMRDLLWPMFDNKFLKQPGVGFKLLLPVEVVYYVDREQKEFYERSRLDKQNLIRSLEWTGQSLYDVASDRLRACTAEGSQPPSLHDLFEDSITQNELIAIFARFRVPRHLFKFLYRLLVDHSNRYTDEAPSWKISRETLQATLALYLRDLDAFDRGMGVA
ncbi:MAG: hypothetical protein KY476_13725 [Planctomycetes bacterium]|nr:hypothetical protein [Planctomycetota bacterium]